MKFQEWIKPKYPPALKKRVAGDWNCGKCNNLNFQFRTVCNRCNAQQEEAKGFAFAVFLTLDPLDNDNQNAQNNSSFSLYKLPEVEYLFKEISIKQSSQPPSPTSSSASTKSDLSQSEEQKSTQKIQTTLQKVTKRPPNSREGD